MLTFVEHMSLAGDRAKQNDDACGFAGARAWVLDGATDLHETPLSDARSDASWIAHHANAALHGLAHEAMRAAIAAASARARRDFDALCRGRAFERWQAPIASLLLIEETPDGLSGLDLGDSRVFALGADGACFTAGGVAAGVDAETQLAAQQKDADKPLLQRSATMEILRAQRAAMNRTGANWTFGIDPACAENARAWSCTLARPAHVLLMTDGFAALTDRYRAYDAAGLVRAALDQGLQELGRALRAIEQADASGARHPRFKQSDDATALLMRLN